MGRLLLNDGIDRQTAERIVSVRYSPLGQSFKERMRRAFSGSKWIYGFNSVGPSGKTVKPFLEQYFEKTGDYKNHLMTLKAKKLVGQFDTVSKAIGNPTLGSTLAKTSFAQCAALQTGDREFQLKEKICALQDTSHSLETRLAIAQELFESEQRLASIEAIQELIFQIDPEKLTQREAVLFKKLSANQKAKREILLMVKTMDSSPLLKITLAKFSLALGWISQNDFESIVAERVKALLAPPTHQNLITIQSMPKFDFPLPLKSADIPDQLYNWYGLGLLAQLKPRDPKIHEKVAMKLNSSDKNIREMAVRALGEMRVQNSRIHREVVKLVNGPNREIARYAVEALTKMKTTDPVAISSITNALTHDDYFLKKSAFEALLELKPRDSATKNKLIELSNSSNRDTQLFGQRLLLELFDSQ